MKTTKNKEIKNISKQMFRIAIPIAISGIIMQVQMLIDTAFLARYTITMPGGTITSGSEILSAVGNVYFPYLVTLSFLWSLSTGAVILVSQRLGAREPENARRYAVTSLKFNTVLSWLVYLFWLLFAEKIFVLMGVHEPILGMSLQYLRFISLELLYMGMASSLGAIFQGMGITRPEMVTGIFRSLLHIGLDYLLIFGHFGFPELGIAGAGIASTAAGLLATLALAFIFFKMKHLAFRPDLMSVLKAPFKDYRAVFKVGLPVGLEDMLWNLGNLVLAFLLNRLNADAVGVYRLVVQIEGTPIFFYMGLARAVTTLVGNRTGERDLSGARRVALVGSTYTALFCAGFTAAFILFPRFILSIFTPDVGLIDKSAPLLVITALTMIPRAINIISGHGIRGYGDTLWMLATQVFGIFFIISLAYILIFPVGLGMIGMFIAMFSDEFLRGVINTIRFYRGEKSLFFKGISATPSVNAEAA
ncbi:MAG: MATE family efflux transporter [Chloroflexota bacterium]